MAGLTIKKKMPVPFSNWTTWRTFTIQTRQSIGKTSCKLDTTSLTPTVFSAQFVWSSSKKWFAQELQSVVTFTAGLVYSAIWIMRGNATGRNALFVAIRYTQVT